MNPSVCANCLNEKPVNETTNRLVTESCGHVKCMDCLLQERDGCVACARETAPQTLDTLEQYEVEEAPREDSPPRDQSQDIIIEVPPLYVYEKQNDKKKKLETKHITVEQDANGRSYYCTVCKRQFHARSQVAYHAYCNGQSKPYQCPVPECDKSFATHSHFKYHMRVHRGERTYACEVCGDSFFQMSKLQRHKLKHTKEKKFACQSCGKAFSNQTVLRAHALTHTHLKPHECEVCGRCFRDRSNLTKHMHKHRGFDSSRPQHGRAFQCPRCPQAFRSKKDMRRHSAVHSDSKPFRCKVCDRRFRRKDNLERHIRNTHRDRAPGSAVDLDHGALSDQLNTTNVDPPPTKNKERSEKTKLEMLNPLPPISQDLLHKHMHSDHLTNIDTTDKSYIIEANNARESVIFGPIRRGPSAKETNEYVHKKKKFNTWNQKVSEEHEVSLPPIDKSKLMKIYNTFHSPDKFDKLKDPFDTPRMEVLPPKNIEVYKNILNPERPEAKEITVASGQGRENGAGENSSTSPQVHWRRKITLNINW